jgi:tetratricopeptide (TPR) repeat protein
MGLLNRLPEHRLTGPAVLRTLMRDGVALMPASVAAMLETPFVGRHRQLHALNDAVEAVTRGSARVVTVHASSGLGKSALVRHFLGQFSRRDDVVVLTGRCYEYESVPYKALDGVIDDLSRYLGSIPAEHVEVLLPPDVSALPRVFPVLRQVDAIANVALRDTSDVIDPLRVRRRAFEALRGLLARLAERRSLVIWIDDLQWADADSMVLLEELLDAASPPVMLTLLSFRSEETATKPFLQALLDRAGRTAWSAVSLEPMTDDEAETLIRELLPRDTTLTADDRRRMARESDGSPLVLEQLALYTGVALGDTVPSRTFAGMFDSRLEALPSSARLFLETLAICGRPVAPEIVCDACGVARDRQSLIVMLRASRLIRSSGSSDRVETYHDRIREVLIEGIAPDVVRGIHGRMVASLVARQSDDCEALFEHYRGAGDPESASAQAGLAAEKASAALAFERAASFYHHALDLAPSSPNVQTWREGLAATLANAGRPAEAAEAYLRAADRAERASRVELQRRAAEQFLTGGHIDRGLDLIGSVLESVGLSRARSPRTAAIRLIWRRAQLRWRGLTFVPRHEDEVDADVLLRLDTCWAAATGLALVDVISASDFVAQHLHMALDAGEPSRIARGMALESSARSADWTFRGGTRRLAERARALVHEVGTPQAMAMESLADSMTASSVGQWKRALSSSEQALTILRDRCVGVTWEMNIAQNMLIWALMYLGELGEVSRRVPALLADARRRGNLYLATELCTRSNYVWLIADDPDEGEREAMDALARWSQKGFHRQHYSAMLARVQTALYRGDGQSAWRLLVEQESSLRASMLLHVQVFRIEWLYLRARSALAMAFATTSDRGLLRTARDFDRRIARERMPWSDGIALLLQGGIASVEGDRAMAQTYLEDAARRFDRADMKLYAAVARRRIGALRRDERGRVLQQQAEAWMTAQEIKNPVSITRMLAPGFPDEPVYSR